MLEEEIECQKRLPKGWVNLLQEWWNKGLTLLEFQNFNSRYLLNY